MPSKKKEQEGAMSVAITEVTLEKNKEVVSKTYSDETIGVHRFVTDPAKIGAKVGLTLNLGNMEFVRIDVSCEIPCYKEEIDDAYAFAQAWCEQRVSNEKKQIVDYRDGKNKSSNPL